MPNHKKYFIIYFFTYFIVDFTTGFNWDFKYWLSVGGPLIGLIVYSLSGLLFSYLIYNKNLSEKKLFFVILIYGFILEIFMFKNPLFLINFFNGMIMLIAIYSLIIYLPKWIVDKSFKSNWKKAVILLALWLFIAISALLNNPHKI